jgi:steroid delta-isomerase-like uncharacterized protein
MSTEQNKALVRRLFDEFYPGNVDVADEIFAAQAELNDSGKMMTVTPEDLKQRHRAQLAAMPDCTITLEDIVCEGDKVAYRWTLRGTQTGMLRGIPPTGKHAVMSGMTIMRVADGKIVAGWHNYDMLGVLQQLGLAPAPGG